MEQVGGILYVGGDFTTVSGNPRPSLAKLDLQTGEFDVDFQPAITGGRVWDLEYVSGRLIVAGAFAPKLAALDPAIGVNTGFITTQVQGSYPGQGQQVYSISASPDGQSLAVVGSFTAVDGVARPRFFMLDLSGPSATLDSYAYAAFADDCAQTGQAYLQSVDFGPDGTWFVVGSRGGTVANPAQIGTHVCSAVARFEVGASTPTWVNYTGGDAITSVLAPGPAVYAQGSSRWLDNPEGSGQAGPGAVTALGGGAIDAETGQALAWDGPHGSGHGGYALLATEDGLWLGNDSPKFDWLDRYGIQYLQLP